MQLEIDQAMLDALKHAGHVPEDLKRRIESVTPLAGAAPARFRLTLSDDEGMELSELLQWHVRTDPATGEPTRETRPYAALIQAISDRQF